MKFDFLRKFSIYLIGFTVTPFFALSVFAQSSSDILKQAEQAYSSQAYTEANKLYKSIWNKIERNKNHLEQAGICSYEGNDLDFSIRCFEQLKSITSKDNVTANLYLAKSYHHKYEFADAIVAYKYYLKSLSKKDPQKSYVKNELLRCSQGLKYKRKLALALVEPVGSNINSVYDEYNPLPDPNQNKNIFISAIRENNQGGKRNDEGLLDQQDGRFRADIYLMNQINGIWTFSSINNSQLNSPMDDIAIGFLNRANVILFYRSWNDVKGTMFMDTISNTSIPLNYPRFISPAIAEIGDHSISIYQDSIMIFSSCRTGGYGGYDLYISFFRNHQWTEAINLGPTINTAFNEDYPFLANDGISLYFSSNNLNSMGGYDIFFTKYRPEARRWTQPKNLGIPLNSAGDDVSFKFTSDGLAGIFCSDRKINNLGGMDIYWAYFKDELSDQISSSIGSPLSGIMYNPEMDIMDRNFFSNKKLKNKIQLEEIKSYSIEPIYYSEENFLTDSKVQKTLEKIIHMMQIHKDLIIQFIGHSYEETQDPINLYFSIKKAEELETYLREKKIQENRIQCIGLGASLPITKYIINGNTSPAIKKLNKRIEINFIKSDTTAILINHLYPVISESMKPDRAGPFNHLRKGLTYSLYLGESGSILNHPLIDSNKGITFVDKKDGDKIYRYYYGIYRQFKEAEAELLKYSSELHPAIEIKAFQSGTELSRADIIHHVLKNAELLLLLNYMNTKDKEKK